MAPIQTYAEADAYLKGGRNKDYRTLPGRSTSLERRDGKTIAVRYHATDVVTYKPPIENLPGLVTLNSGGWRTMTTKDRMCCYSPVVVAQDRGLWYVAKPPAYWQNRDEWLLFEDGFTVTDSGQVVGERTDPKPLEAAKRKVDRLVSRYVKGYLDHLRDVGHVEEPGPGDCWYCRMRTQDGATLGDKTSVDHLLSHFEEGYYVPSLFINAVEERNYGGGVGFVIQTVNGYLEHGHSIDWMAGQSLRAYLGKRKLALAQEIMEGR